MTPEPDPRRIHLRRQVGALLMVVHAPLGAAILAVDGALSGVGSVSRRLGPWALIWAPVMLLGLGLWVSGTFVAELVLGSIAAILAGLLFVGVDARAPRALLLGLLVVCVGFGAERYVATTTWRHTNDDRVALHQYLAVTGVERLEGTPDARAFERSWERAGADTDITVSFDVRLAEGVTGASWFRYHPAIDVRPMIDRPGFARVTTPPGVGSYVTRRIDTRSPIGGRTFRARLLFRAGESVEIAAAACRGVVLREVGGTGVAGCFDHTVPTGWGEIEHVWRVPPEATSSILRIELRVPASWYEVGDVRLEELVGGDWQPLGPLEPTGLLVAFAGAGIPPVSWLGTTVVPSPTWQTVTLRHDGSSAGAGGAIRLVVRPEPGTMLEVRRVDAVAGVVHLRPRALPARGRAWFEHANLAGHSLATAGMIATAAAPSGVGMAAAASASLLAVALTGSRTAWIVLLVAVPILIVGASRGRRFGRIAFLVVAVAVALAAASATGVLPERLALLSHGDGNAVPRAEIWSFAWNAMLERPLTGVGHDRFATTWVELANGDGRPPPEHAHNLLLHFGASYGIAGLLCAVWLVCSLLWYAFRRLGGLPLVVTLFVLALQVTDYTLLHAGVLYPFIYGLALLSAPDALRSSAGPARER